MNSAVKLMRTDPTVSEDAELAAVLEAYFQALEAGAAPCVEELIAQHPALADRLERCLASLQFVEGAASQMVLPAPLDDLTDENRRLGDYRLIREIGRGGMGVVYEAEQVSLARRVAHKGLPFASVLDSRQLQRFQNEALAAANLDHPNIVAVHGVGCERGVHFYVMRLISGTTLAQLVAHPAADATSAPALPPDTVVAGELSTLRSKRPKQFFTRLAQLGIQAAEALEHAHQMGVVHRDIKPSNLLIDDHGKLWVTDFGLAQVESNATLTLPGDVLGTLRYMSPEQAAGRPTMIDHRTDIYSLGATLYELATDRPVVQAQERAAILREIAEKDPANPRKYTPSMPADLETILLKCLNKEPSARYDSAQALASDLRRFLEQKPVVARRRTMLDSAVRWGKCHRDLLAIVCVAGLAIVVVSTVLTLALLAERNALQTLNRDLLLVVEYYEKRDEWARTDAPAEAASSLLGSLEQSSGNTNTKRALANTHLYIANATPEVSPTKSPNQDYVTAVRLLEELVEQNPADAGLQSDLAVAHNALGNHLYTDCGEYATAFVHWRRAYNLWKACEGERFWLDTSYLAFSVKIAETYAYCPDRSVRGGPESLFIAKEWLEHTPASSDVMMLKGAAYCANGDWRRAKATLKDVPPSLFRGHPGFLLALAEAHLGETEAALVHLTESNKWNVDTFPMFEGDARLRWAHFGTEAAFKCVKAAIDESRARATMQNAKLNDS